MQLLTIEEQLTGVASALLPLFKDPQVTDILINGYETAYFEREGKLTAFENPFQDYTQVRQWMERLLIPIHKRLDARSPYVDGRLLDGSRFHIIMPPLAVNGPFISFRKKRPIHDCPLSSFGSSEQIDWLIQQVVLRKNILIVGGTGSGKTTLLARCLELVPADERIVIIEENRELEIHHPHVLSMEARPATPEGVGEVSLRELLKNALRMRPDRLILGECRGGEALEMLQAINTGHNGSLGTLHASGALDGLRRFESLVLSAGVTLPHRIVREWVASNLQAVVFLKKEGLHRRIEEVITVHGLEGERYRINPLCYKALKAV